jgi:acyl carrier protein
MAEPTFTMTELMDILVTKAGLPRTAVTDDLDVTLGDVDLDSLARIQLRTEIASRYGVEIDDERTDATFGELLSFVNEGLNEELSEHAR